MSSTAVKPRVNSSSTDPAGLTSREAAERAEKFGPNDPAPRRKHSEVAELFLLFVNPMVLILLFAALVSGFIGHMIDAAIIVSMVLLSIPINFYQMYRSRSAIESLRARTAPTATVLRDGNWEEINRVEVVPGDVVRLSAGDLVPADARLMTARDLYVQEAALTGESLPSEKNANNDNASAMMEEHNMVFLGTSIISGTATAEVIATGRQTQFVI